jgi:hypothetical protein
VLRREVDLNTAVSFQEGRSGCTKLRKQVSLKPKALFFQTFRVF